MSRFVFEAKRTAKLRVLGLLRYGFSIASTARRDGPSLRALIVSDGVSPTSEEQLAPFYRSRAALESRFGLAFAHVPLDDVAILLDWGSTSLFEGFDVIFLKAYFRTIYNPELIAGALRAAAPRAKLVYLDGDDDTGVQWPGILRHVDLYVKKHVLADRRLYTQSMIGKCNLTDYVARTYGVSFDGTDVAWTTPIRPHLLDRIVVGYNIALDAKIDALARNSPPIDHRRREWDVHCRATVPRDNWLGHLRRDIAPRLAAMSGDIRCLAPTTRVDQAQYYAELRTSKCCVSPFGFGEICWRDFEAILCGSLLLKPDMSHLETSPDLFRPGETYVPLQWDYSDLEEKVRYYVAHEAERRAIVERARAVLAGALDEEWFLRWFAGLIDRLRIGRSTEAVQAAE
ncbi:glycosyltransferase [Sandaracinus amylolyticus]|uniref:glycosyltransferase n=1 Tax=Sandaracinus amylolyticus TaxID=927083 RepID=UPI001F3A9CBD|nr:glycosyltransferase [Sandaracinus amylolyticus]UJR87124.1 Hypothetical protein I5071_92250 [Sandaracinus amylolyticus]